MRVPEECFLGAPDRLKPVPPGSFLFAFEINPTHYNEPVFTLGSMYAAMRHSHGWLNTVDMQLSDTVTDSPQPVSRLR